MGEFSCGDNEVCRRRGIEHCSFRVGGTDEDEIVKFTQRHVEKQHGEELTSQQVLDSMM